MLFRSLVERRLASAPAADADPGPEPEAAAGAHGDAPDDAAAGPGPVPSEGPAVDPVCGMTVDRATSRVTLALGGTVYHFCCEGCRDRFRDDPAAYGAASATGG